MQEISSYPVKVARGAVYTYLQNAAGILTSLLYFPVLVRILSREEVGLTVILGLILTLAMTLGSFSLPKAITKFVAEDVGKERWGALKSLYRKSVRFSIVLGGATSLALLLISSTFSYYFNSLRLSPELMVLLSANILILSALSFLNAFLYGLQKFKEIALIGLLSNMVRVGSVVILLLLSYGVAGVLFGWIIGDLVGIVLYLFSAYKIANSFINDGEDVNTSKLFKYSMPLFGTSIVEYLSTYIDRFLLLGLIGLSGVAIYSVAVTASSFLAMISYPITYVLFPFFSELYGKNSNETLQMVSLKVTRYTSIIFVPMAVGLIAVSYSAIRIFAGDAYAEATLPLAILCFTMAFTQVGVAVTPALLSLGRTKTLFNGYVLGIITNTVIVLALAPLIGIVGAALARTGLMIVSFSYCVYALRRSHGFYVDKEAFYKAWISSLVMAIVVFVVQSLFSFNARLTPLYILLGVITYILLIRWLKLMNYEDSLVFKNLFPKVFGRATGLFTRLFGVKNPH